jgi:phenylacetate-CoA ligase
MPFIRYRIGDMASWGSRCRCGRGSHVLKSLQGRSNQFMVLPSGRLYMSTLISAFMKRVPGLLHYQTVQESEDLLCVKFVPDGTVKDVHHQIVEAVRKSLPEPMRIEAEEVDRIPPGPVGKLCNFISKVRTA